MIIDGIVILETALLAICALAPRYGVVDPSSANTAFELGIIGLFAGSVLALLGALIAWSSQEHRAKGHRTKRRYRWTPIVGTSIAWAVTLSCSIYEIGVVNSRTSFGELSAPSFAFYPQLYACLGFGFYHAAAALLRESRLTQEGRTSKLVWLLDTPSFWLLQLALLACSVMPRNRAYDLAGDATVEQLVQVLLLVGIFAAPVGLALMKIGGSPAKEGIVAAPRKLRFVALGALVAAACALMVSHEQAIAQAFCALVGTPAPSERFFDAPQGLVLTLLFSHAVCLVATMAEERSHT